MKKEGVRKKEEGGRTKEEGGTVTAFLDGTRGGGISEARFFATDETYTRQDSDN
jgi:hypothetical protein